MEARARKAIWWPFTQHDSLGEGGVNLLDSAYGEYFCTAEVERSSTSTDVVGSEVRGRALGQQMIFCFLHPSVQKVGYVSSPLL